MLIMSQALFKALLIIKINLNEVSVIFTDKEKPSLREVKRLSVVAQLTKHC